LVKEYHANLRGKMRGKRIHVGGDVQKVYKEMEKEMNVIASQEEPSQQQHASDVCLHSFILYVH
jgi:hypothetical protein